MADDKGLIFLHMPKAGGLTLQSIIDRQYPRRVIYKLYGPQSMIDKFIKLPEQSRSQIRVLQGHVPFGLHKQMTVPVNYITMLRDPVERVISLYYWILETRADPLYQIVKGMSLGNFADSGFAIASNYQTRLISGLMNDSEEALEAAKYNLGVPDTIFGLTERFDESLILFKNHLGWKSVIYAKRNVTRSRPNRQEVAEEVIRIIENHNGLDIELYKFAKRRFEEIISKQGPSLQHEVRKLQRLSQIYGKFSEGLNTVRRALPPQVRASLRKGLRIFRNH